MRFDEFDRNMRRFEQSLDQVLMPDCYMIARLDGRGFTRLTKEICKFEAPFDTKFRNMMTDTTKALMDCGFRVIYGYTESDEISLLFHKDDETFGRKVRKFDSILAGTASANFTLKLGLQAVFDCRMILLPDIEHVCDYFLWRQEDANRNALNSHCYWTLRKDGMNARAATNDMKNKSVGYKNELLFQHGINYDTLPSWQKRGVGMWYKEQTKIGFNPLTEEKVETTRRVIHEEYELPLGREYAEMITEIIASAI
jgi:tRNA(His) 5'-end guanylyltransferase